MKANFYITALSCLFTFYFGISQEKEHCPENGYDFQVGEQVYVFGNNVKLRSAPKTESKVLELLRIGEWVEIIEKTEFSWPYKGYDSPFYKVKYDTMEGYIIGGLLSLEKKTVGDNQYFFAFSKAGERSYLNVRHLDKGKYAEQKIPLSHTNVSIHVLENKGIDEIDNILYVDYHSSAGGAEDGGIYFFVQGNQLHYIGELSQVSDSGSYFNSEKFIFPDDKNGIPGAILFKKDRGELLDEATEWVQTSTETRKLQWIEGRLIPNFREKFPD